ncbi:MAG TPA: hypothetical protein VFP21_05845 [Solirubrobacterales bacterium]|nr:hypothetical protein [Solirubrobacterales bacterium]
MRPSFPLSLVAVAAVLLTGCGGSGETSTPSPAGTGASKQDVRAAWERTPECKHPQGASRWGCSVGPDRCQGVVTDRGWSISCAKPGSSVSFTVRRG